MNGILPLWKPKGMTSHDCVFRARKILQTKKIGHTGTLDPDVEGVLPLCIGQGTKVVPYLTDTSKTYIAEVTLGSSTETEDKSGAVVETKDFASSFDSEKLKQVLRTFEGKLQQIPPMYSAIKVNGKKLYEYARKNQFVERPSRQITIHAIKLDSASIKENGKIFRFEADCSKGTYIRTLCVDIGKALGYPAHMSDLTRTRAGAFYAKDCVTFAKMEEAMQEGAAEALLQPITAAVSHLPLIEADEQMKKKVGFGQRLPRPSEAELYRVEQQGELLAIYEVHPEYKNMLKPKRVFLT